MKVISQKSVLSMMGFFIFNKQKKTSTEDIICNKRVLILIVKIHIKLMGEIYEEKTNCTFGATSGWNIYRGVPI